MKKNLKIFPQIPNLRTPCKLFTKHIYTEKISLIITVTMIPRTLKLKVRKQSYDQKTKSANLPPLKNRNELKFSESIFLPLTHHMSKFQRVCEQKKASGHPRLPPFITQ